MACLIVLLAAMVPRVTMFFIWALTDWFSQAYRTVVWPLLGFFFMPYTTLAYMVAMLRNNNQLTGGWIVLLVVAVIVDLGAYSGGRAAQRRR